VKRFPFCIPGWAWQSSQRSGQEQRSTWSSWWRVGGAKK